MAAVSVAVIGGTANETNLALVSEWRARGLPCELVDPCDARKSAFAVALGRIDVLPTLDGVESGLAELLWLERGGTPVLNRALALLRTHDKLRTAAALRRAGLPHPATWQLQARELELGRLPRPPVVVKPRFGSWGQDVRLCLTDDDMANALLEFSSRTWFRRHGALVQDAIPTSGFDLRLVVAGGRVVGAIERHPEPGEWRTNVSVGASRHPASPDSRARALAVAAAEAVGADLVGVDLMPLPDGSYVVLELNGAADFGASYSPDRDIYADVADALGLTRVGTSWSSEARVVDGTPAQALT